MCAGYVSQKFERRSAALRPELQLAASTVEEGESARDNNSEEAELKANENTPDFVIENPSSPPRLVRKFVSFEHTVHYHTILNKDDITPEERAAYWGSHNDFKAFKGDDLKTICPLMAGESHLHSEDLCMHSLEDYTFEDKKLRRFLITNSRDDLFSEQLKIREQQFFSFVPNSDVLLSQIYCEYSKLALEAARLRAMRNEFDMMDDYEDDYEYYFKDICDSNSTDSTFVSSGESIRSIEEARENSDLRSFDDDEDDPEWETDEKCDKISEDDDFIFQWNLISSHGSSHNHNQRHSIMCRSPYRSSLIESAIQCSDLSF